MRWVLLLALAGCELDGPSAPPAPRTPDECAQVGGIVVRDTYGNVLCDLDARAPGFVHASVSAADAGAED